MVHPNEFSYGLLTPGFAFAISCLGSFLGLRCADRARACTGASRVGWLLFAAISIGAAGIWVMHNIALLGFSIPGQAVRYDIPMSFLSALVAVAVVFGALLITEYGGEGNIALLLGGIVIGGGVLTSMDYVGMAAMRMPDTISYDIPVVLLSVLVAVIAASFSLWAALRLHGIRTTLVASVAMAVAINGMHYTAMTAMRFAATPGEAGMTGGATAAEFVIPLVLAIAILTIVLTVVIALSPTEEEMRAEALLLARAARNQRGRV